MCRRVRARIRSLEQRIHELEVSQATERASLERRLDNRLKRREEELLKELERGREQMRGDYERRVREVQVALQQEMHRQIDELRDYDAKAQRKRQELLKELQTVNNQLKAELDEIKSNQQKHDETSQAEALQLKCEAYEQRGVVELLPHSFFCKGQLEILDEHLQRVEGFLKQEMFEAAASTAGICSSELRILEINVRSLQYEWEQLFQEYCGRATTLFNYMKQFESMPIHSLLGDFLLNDDDRAYYSDGYYPEVHEDVLMSYKLVNSVEGAGGPSAYLRDKEACEKVPRGMRMVEAITDLQKLADRLRAATTCIQNEMVLSDERQYLAGEAERLLRDSGYRLVRKGYRDGKALDSFQIELSTTSAEFILRLTFVPVREDGVAICNACLIALDLGAYSNRQLIGGIAKRVKEKLQNGLSVQMRVEWDGLQAEDMTRDEYKLKSILNAEQLVRRFERKYQR